jgi:hypothetical protein
MGEFALATSRRLRGDREYPWSALMPGSRDATDADLEQLIASGKMLSFAGAQRVKENFLAR